MNGSTDDTMCSITITSATLVSLEKPINFMQKNLLYSATSRASNLSHASFQFIAVKTNMYSCTTLVAINISMRRIWLPRRRYEINLSRRLLANDLFTLINLRLILLWVIHGLRNKNCPRSRRSKGGRIKGSN